jgi:hypothetical protein
MMSRGHTRQISKISDDRTSIEETIIVGPGFVTNMMEQAVQWADGRQEYAVRRSIIGISGMTPRPMAEQILKKNIRQDGDMSKIVVTYKQGHLLLAEFILQHGDVQTRRMPDGTIMLLCELCGRRIDIGEKFILPVPGWTGIPEYVRGCSLKVLTDEIYGAKDVYDQDRLPRSGEADAGDGAESTVEATRHAADAVRAARTGVAGSEALDREGTVVPTSYDSAEQPRVKSGNTAAESNDGIAVVGNSISTGEARTDGGQA